MPVVWALRRTVSICNNKGSFGLVTVTDQDKRLATAKRSRSVTSGRLKTVYLLQIRTFGTWLGHRRAGLSIPISSLFSVNRYARL